MEKDFVLVFITVPNGEIAQKIAARLVEDNLAACVNILSPLQSLYMWQSKMNNDSEILLIVKSRASIFHELLIPAVRAIHPYQVPEIIATPILMGSPDYMQWMDDTIRKNP
jgi:periplasmic divalent cation tolerance protein